MNTQFYWKNHHRLAQLPPHGTESLHLQSHLQTPAEASHMELKQWNIFEHLDPVFAGDVRFAYVLGPVGDAAVMVMKNDDVYSIGSSEHGMLGVKGTTSSPVPMKITELSGQRVKGFSCGEQHVVAYTESGAVYAWGDNTHHQLGIRNSSVHKSEVPIHVTESLTGKHVIQVACGLNHTLALTEDGEVYAWGHNLKGQVGSGSAHEHEKLPVRVVTPPQADRDSKIMSIACSPKMSFAIQKNGKVLNWGCLKYPEEKAHDHQRTPKIVPLRWPIVKIACGMHNVMALSSEYKLYVWKPDESMYSTPEKVGRELGPILDMGATIHSETLACKTMRSGVYVWGHWYGDMHATPIKTRFATVDQVFAHADFPIMCSVLEIERLGSRLADAWQTAFNDPDTSDLDFLVNGQTIHAHRLFLRVRSNYFRKKIDEEWKNDSVVNIKEFSYNVFRALIYYLYTDRIDPGPYEQAIELLRMAELLEETDLHRRCEEQMQAGITVDNVCKLYSIAAQFKAHRLQESTRRFMIPNLAAVIRSDAFGQLGGEMLTKLMRELADLKAFG